LPPALKCLIVNGDDFGVSSGVNHGIVQAHERGVVTSTSLMVDAPRSEEAVRLAAGHPELGIGLHVVLPDGYGDLEAEIGRQLKRFIELMGELPTHLDSHHHVHRDETMLPAFFTIAERHGLPLRDRCGAHHIGSFYAQWDGVTHLEAITPEALEVILEEEVSEGFNELCCHPGLGDSELDSSYSVERQAELETLCSPAVTAAIEQRAIRLVTFRELPRL
jgi:predicted glycoside hydrolase/deacetylase ChbG (UPF0249 family)